MPCPILYVDPIEALMIQESKNILLGILKHKLDIMMGHNSFFIITITKENKPSFKDKFNFILEKILRTLCPHRSEPPPPTSSLDVSPPTPPPPPTLLILSPYMDDYI